jgi:hypothetical protein
MKTKKLGDLESFPIAVRDNWYIKMSIWKDKYVLLIVRSILTGQTVIRQFEKKEEAASFIDFIGEHNAAEEHDFDDYDI